MRHRDCLFAPSVDLDVDQLPEPLRADLRAAEIGDRVTTAIGARSEPTPSGTIRNLADTTFRSGGRTGFVIQPRRGRFYPGIYLANLLEDQNNELKSFRYLGSQDGLMSLDLGHPLADHELQVSVIVRGATTGMGGGDRPPIDWMARLVDGPGLQACWRGQPTDFLFEGAFGRVDEQDDSLFYATRRLVTHLDRRAQDVVGELYRGVIGDDAVVLDLLSSFHSNLAAEQRYAALIGLGLNDGEMAANRRLTGAVVHDLNRHPTLPFADGSLDAVICTVSVDYLVHPVAVFTEVGRCLRPGGRFAVTFSNRWFPPKVTRLWNELYPFERIGLVISFFDGAGCYGDIESFSMRGLPRPADDAYTAQTSESDPIFAVIGRRVDGKSVRR